MNQVMRSLAAQNGVRTRLGDGEPGLMKLLGGFGASEEEGGLRIGGGATGSVSRIAKVLRDSRQGGGGGSLPGTGGTGTGGGGVGCVDIDTILPGGLRAGDVKPGDLLQVVDPLTLERRLGEVTFSTTKLALRFRLTWRNGVTLKCSDTAPIPTAGGTLRTPLELCGEDSLTERDGLLALSSIVQVQRLGLGWVQHITCGNACFLVGDVEGQYALHHNTKGASGGGPL